MLSSFLIAQPGAQKLESLEWANFGTGNGLGYVIYTPNADGQPQYVLMSTLLAAVADSDDQILTIDYNPTTKIISGELEDGGGPFSMSLFDLEDRLELVGNSLRIIGNTEAAIDLSPYLDNTDDQQVLDFTLTGDILTLEIEGNAPVDVNIASVEVDPVFVLSAAHGITQADIDSWRNHVLNDNDTDDENEFITLTKTLPNEILVEDGIHGGPRKLHFIYQGNGVVNGNGVSGGSQFLEVRNDSLFISGGNGVYIGDVSNTGDCATFSGLTAATFTIPGTLSAEPDERRIFLQGVMMTENATPTHRQHVNITNNQTLNFNEALKAYYTIRVCGIQ